MVLLHITQEKSTNASLTSMGTEVTAPSSLLLPAQLNTLSPLMREENAIAPFPLLLPVLAPVNAMAIYSILNILAAALNEVSMVQVVPYTKMLLRFKIASQRHAIQI